MADELRIYNDDDLNDRPQRRICAMQPFYPLQNPPLPPFVIPPVADSLLRALHWYQQFQRLSLSSSSSSLSSSSPPAAMSPPPAAPSNAAVASAAAMAALPGAATNSPFHHNQYHSQYHSQHLNYTNHLHHHHHHLHNNHLHQHNENYIHHTHKTINHKHHNHSNVAQQLKQEQVSKREQHVAAAAAAAQDDADVEVEAEAESECAATSSALSSPASQQHIKKPLNPFMLFMKKQRPDIVKQGTVKESATINRMLGEQWRLLTKEQQEPYYKLAEQEKLIHAQKYPHWTARDNYAIQKKRKKQKLKTIAPDQSDKKCRARFGVDNMSSWCKPCRRKKKCRLVYS